MVANITISETGKLLFEGKNSLIYLIKEDNTLMKKVIKVLRDEYPSPEKIARFNNEYECTCELNVPGVRRAMATTRYEGRYAIVLEYFEGLTLNHYFKGARRNIDEFLSIAIKIAGILKQVHQNGIIHKDINGANILVNPTTHEIRLIDFGISSRLKLRVESQINPERLEGTLAYISPEQTGRMNRSVDNRTDLYSLGATFYALLAGRPPFKEKDNISLVHAHIALTPHPLAELPGEQIPGGEVIPAPLSTIVARLMEKNAEDRYQSAAGLEADLKECLSILKDRDNFEQRTRSFRVGRNDHPTTFRIAQKLYGREREVVSLLEEFEKITEGESGLTLVTGYSGVGKSTLVGEIHKPITRLRGSFASGKFDQYHRNIPFFAFIQAIDELCLRILTRGPGELKTWRKKILQGLGVNAQVLVSLIPNLEKITGKQPPVTPLGPGESLSRLLIVIKDFVKSMSQAEHPLVLFIDDLQWADPASLEVLKTLLYSKDLGYFLLIGAYRDNEVDEKHPLMTGLAELKKRNIIPAEIKIKNLEEKDITQLLADTLRVDPGKVASLSKLTYKKTGGNVFFCRTFLTSLYEEGLLKVNPASGVWSWELEKIRAREITENVVELMMRRLQKLPESSGEILRLGACIGTRFDIKTLSIISEKQPIDSLSDLWPAIEAGLVTPLDQRFRLLKIEGENEAAFRFYHDRVYQAAYALIPDSRKSEIHLRIGRLLLKNIPEEDYQSRIFDIVFQLNTGAPLLEKPEELERLAALNLMAGEKAKSSAAYEGAYDYWKFALSLLEKIDSTYIFKDVKLKYKLQLGAAEVSYLNADFQTQEKLCNLLKSNIPENDLENRYLVYQIEVASLLVQGKLLEAIKTALKVLSELGVDFPPTPGEEEIGGAITSMAATLADKEPASLLELPPMQDRAKSMAMPLLAKLLPPTYVAAPALLPLIIMKQVELSITYGNAPSSHFAYASYALFQCGALGDIETGYRFAKLAEDLMRKTGDLEFKAKTLMTIPSFITHWKEHFEDNIHYYVEGYQAALEVGDLEFAGYNTSNIPYYQFMAGRPLSLARDAARANEDFFQKTGVEVSSNQNRLIRQLCETLMGLTDEPHRLKGEIFDEDIEIPRLKESHQHSNLFCVYISKMIITYLHGDYNAALTNARHVTELLGYGVGHPYMHYYPFYNALILTALYPDTPEELRAKRAGEIERELEIVKDRAKHGPINFLHKFHLMTAEWARVRGETDLAIKSYKEAIDQAQRHKYPQEEALGLELFARFWLTRNLEDVARLYMGRARHLYSIWEANALVYNLEINHPTLVRSESEIDSRRSGGGTFGMVTEGDTVGSNEGDRSLLDFATIMKASQTLSGKMKLSSLLENMIRILMENAGARRACLLLGQNENFLIEAEGQIEENQSQASISVFSSRPPEGDILPISILNFVARTKEALVLDESLEADKFSDDPYILKEKPRSILCHPIIHQGELNGLVYLENNFLGGAFTQERIEVIDLLASQAAISLENARVYENLEKLVAIRTGELEETHKKLLETAHRVGMAEVASNVLHNVGNTLTNVTTPVSILMENLRGSRLDSLGRLIHLLKENQSNLAEFLQTDSRGQKAIPFLEQLYSRLQGEQKRFVERVEEVHQGVRQINGIIQLQQSYAGNLILEEELSPAVLLEDALKIENAALEQNKIQVIRAIDEVQPLKSDRHKLMVILLNLLKNAREALLESKNTTRELTVRVKSLAPERIIIQIEDNGPGIKTDLLTRIFQQGYSEKENSPGFGLHSAANAASELGGKLTAASEGADTGAVFTLELPIPG